MADLLTTLALFFSILACLLIMCEWAYVIFWTRRVANGIIGKVFSGLANLKRGRGKLPTAIEEMDTMSGESPTAALAAPPADGDATLGGIPPEVVQAGLPIIQKMLANQPLTPDEKSLGMKLLTEYGLPAFNRMRKGAAQSQGPQSYGSLESGAWG